MANPVYSAAQISLASLDARCSSHKGLQVADPAKVLGSLQGSNITVTDLSPYRPTAAYTGVQSSPKGIIQDPAGVSIGSGQRPHDMVSVGGASLQIYNRFHDLEPVPSIPKGASVFNTSTGPGSRVLHTYSPELGGSPSNLADCKLAIEQLATAYANALQAVLNAPAAVKSTSDDHLINLSPLAGKIFAYSFKDPILDHLHPTYTLMALMLAQAWLLNNKLTPPPAVLHYFQKPGEHQFDAIVDSLIDQFYTSS